MKKILLAIVLFSISINIFSTNIDSLLANNKKMTGKEKVNNLMQILMYYAKYNRPQLDEYFNQRDIILKQLNTEYQIDYLIGLSDILRNVNENDNSLILLNEAKNLNSEFGINERTAEITLLEGNCYFQKNETLKALEKYIETEKISDTNNYQSILYKVYNNIGAMYFDLKMYEEMEEYLLKAIKLKEEMGLYDELFQSYNNLGSLKAKLGDLDKALFYFKKSLEFKRKYNKDALALSLLNNIAGIYQMQKEYDLALDYLFESQELAYAIKDSSYMAFVLNNIGFIYTEKGDYDKALENFDNAIEIVEKTGDKSEKSKILLNYMTFYEKFNNYKEAYKIQTEYYSLVVSLRNDENEKDLEILINSYEMDKKNKEIELLKKAEKIQKIQKKYLISVIVFLFLLLLFLIYFVRFIKKKNQILLNQKLEIEKHKDKLLQEINVRKLIESQLEKSNEKYKQLFENSADGIVLIQDNQIKLVNKRFSEIFKLDRESIYSMSLDDFFEGYEKIEDQYFECKYTVDEENILDIEILKDNIELNDHMAEILFVKDVTKKKQAEREKVEKERLQGVLEMAGAVCHELNQPLQVVLGYSEMLMSGDKIQESTAKKLDKISFNLKRMGKITENLMHITSYKTKKYHNDSNIIDIDQALKS